MASAQIEALRLDFLNDTFRSDVVGVELRQRRRQDHGSRPVRARELNEGS
jgi:hypothetical protein